MCSKWRWEIRRYPLRPALSHSLRQLSSGRARQRQSCNGSQYGAAQQQIGFPSQSVQQGVHTCCRNFCLHIAVTLSSGYSYKHICASSNVSSALLLGWLLYHSHVLQQESSRNAHIKLGAIFDAGREAVHGPGCQSPVLLGRSVRHKKQERVQPLPHPQQMPATHQTLQCQESSRALANTLPGSCKNTAATLLQEMTVAATLPLDESHSPPVRLQFQ